VLCIQKLISIKLSHDVGPWTFDGRCWNTASSRQLCLSGQSQRCIGVETGCIRISIWCRIQLHLLARKRFGEWNLQLSDQKHKIMKLYNYTLVKKSEYADSKKPTEDIATVTEAALIQLRGKPLISSIKKYVLYEQNWKTRLNSPQLNCHLSRLSTWAELDQALSRNFQSPSVLRMLYTHVNLVQELICENGKTKVYHSLPRLLAFSSCRCQHLQCLTADCLRCCIRSACSLTTSDV